jgi:pseudaminic acid biosynthesis-associated methylase
MTNRFQTDQEEFWAGQFGDEYISRNKGNLLIGSNCALFSKALAHCSNAKTLIEFGANVGLNLRAIRQLRPDLLLDAIEINANAVNELESWGGVRKIHHQSILEFKTSNTWDIVLIKGVLIHINPEFLPIVYDALYRSSDRYIIVIEYYNPSPVEIPYRGHPGKLFKRDFAGEMLDKFADLRIVDYGFVWRRDPVFPQDDATWFVLEKQ